MEKESIWLNEFCEKARQAETALMELHNMLPDAGGEILRNAPPGGIRQALAYGRGIRGEYYSFVQRFAAFEEKACYLLKDYEGSFAARRQAEAEALPTPAAVKEALREGTPKYEALRALPGWPDLIDPEAVAQDFGNANEIYFIDQPSWPAWGSFDHKAVFLMRGKMEKMAKRRASAMHHLCIILSEFQRPGDPSNGGRASKRAIAQLIRDYVEQWQDLETQAVEAILEAADQR